MRLVSEWDHLLPDWFDPTKVEGPTYTPEGSISWTCHDHETCRAREADGRTHRCHADIAHAMHIMAAVSEGFCPEHQNCRLVPTDKPEARFEVDAYGLCPRCGKTWATGAEPDGKPWWQWDRPPPPRPAWGMPLL